MQSLDPTNVEHKLMINSPMAQKYTNAKEAVKSGVMNRQNIIDLVDTIVQRKRISPAFSIIFKNFLLKQIICCRRGCLFRDE